MGDLFLKLYRDVATSKIGSWATQWDSTMTLLIQCFVESGYGHIVCVCVHVYDTQARTDKVK